MNQINDFPEGDISRTVKKAINTNGFYRKKYIKFNEVNSFTRDVFQNLPFTKKDEFYSENGLETPFKVRNESDYVFIENGNFEVKNANFWNIEYLKKQVSILEGVFTDLGLNNDDRILNLLLPGISGTYFVLNSAFENIGSTIVPLGEEAELEVIDFFINELSINVLIGKSDKLFSIVKHYEENNKEISLKAVFIIGGNLSKNNFGKKITSSIYYPVLFSIETGIIGIQCPELPLGSFHTTDMTYIELIDPISKNLVNNTIGELVFTSFHDRINPIIRYQTGFDIRILENTCKCGNSNFIFKLNDI